MSRISDARKIFVDGLGIIHKLDKMKYPVMILKSLVRAAVPFVAIILSAEIINRLTSGGTFGETLTFALISVGAIFLLSLVGEILTKIDEVKTRNCVRLYEFGKNKKMMEMDFSELESPNLSDIRAKLEIAEIQGYNMWGLLFRIDSLCRDILTVVMSLGLLLPILINARGLPIFWFSAFMLTSIILSILISLLRKRADDLVNESIRDNSNRSDSWLVSRRLLSENELKYNEGKDIRIYRFQNAIWNRLSDSYRELYTSYERLSTLTMGFAEGAGGAVRMIIMGSSFIFVAASMSGVMALGTIILFSSLMYQFIQSISQSIKTFGGVYAVMKSFRLYTEFTHLPESRDKGSFKLEKDIAEKRAAHAIRFENVSFKYPGSERYALKNLNLKFETGKRLAVVGMNGSGKTTMIKLLCRLYDPTDGEILLNGVNIQEYDLTEYRRIFSVVFQDFKLFSFTLGEVLASSAEYDETLSENCLEKVGLRERYLEMSDGLKTYLYKDYDDGVELSGGEAQKTALARALYKNAPFIVLDEPTAALDPISEFEIYSKFNDIVEDKTAIFISHRLSSCRFCDDIAVFHEGELIQRGSHDALVSDEDGKYFELWNAQAQYYS
jgi:ATP-binding cassette subfamily B protein